VVVMVEDGRHALDVTGDDPRPFVVAGRDRADQTRHERELTPEHVVQHVHFAAVEVRRGGNRHSALQINLRFRKRGDVNEPKTIDIARVMLIPDLLKIWE
jgi:hypothetical protein